MFLVASVTGIMDNIGELEPGLAASKPRDPDPAFSVRNLCLRPPGQALQAWES